MNNNVWLDDHTPGAVWTRGTRKRVSVINGRAARPYRAAWLYKIETEVGDLFIVDYEQADKAIKRRIFDGDEAGAAKYYEAVMKRIIKEEAQ